jgi:hypothetical protein
VGGCVTIIGASNAKFTDDTFTQCLGITGGAIAAIDFKDLIVENCQFGGGNTQNNFLNIAFSGRGENIFA